MLELNGYEIGQRINADSFVEIYRGTKSQDNLPVILKNIPITDELSDEIINLRNEYEILKYLESPIMIHVLDFKKHSQGHVLVIEDIGGNSLKDYIESGSIAIEDFLRISIEIAEILGFIHRKKVIHKDIKPSNIVLNANKKITRVIDFGISTRLSKEETTLSSPNVLEGSIQYISPEQTGRMNRSVDYRTDFYSLGITFYEILTGELPFFSEDLLELIHFHLAKSPEPPNQKNPKIPKIISDIILKLMEKTAENRYQSAEGLSFDLERCLQELKEKNQIEEFPIGEKDIKSEFSIPQKLYGREKEIQILIDSFENMCQTGISSLMLIGGYSGVGKSALLKEITKPLTKSRGYFVTGKYDQFNKNLPYSAIIQVFTNLIRLILTEEPEKIVVWKNKLQNAIKANAGVITEVIPELEIIIGKQPHVPELGAQENANRFYLTFLNFIKVFADEKHPLAIFLDDLQWADTSSFALLKNLLEDPSAKYIYLMIAYRENEVSPEHPLFKLIKELENTGLKLENIQLEPLIEDSISQILQDCLFRSKEELRKLTHIVLSKTGGNPFFITELLKQLARDELIYFSFEEKQWRYKAEEISKTNISDNVIELLINRITKLPKDIQSVMQLASCIGNQFELSTLSIISKSTPYETGRLLERAIEEEMIVPFGDGYKKLETLPRDSGKMAVVKAKRIKYRFQHDRVQQAAYELIKEEQKKSTRLDIGRILLNTLSDTEIEERLFDIVNHLNEGIDMVLSNEEKQNYLQLNFRAGKKAKASTAYKPALDYIKNAIRFLDETSWDTNYQLTYELYKELAEIEYLNANFDDSEMVIYYSLDKVKDPIEKAELYQLLIIQYTLSAKYPEAIQALKNGVLPLGVEIPNENFQEVIGSELEKIKKTLAGKDVHSLLDMPMVQSEELKIALKLLTTATPTSYFLSPELWTTIVLKTVNLCLENGNVGETYGYSCYGIMLCSAFGEFKMGYDFAEIAVTISEKFGNQSAKTKAANVFANHVNSWVKHIKEAQKINQDGFQCGLDAGEFQHASYIVLHIPVNLFHQGVPLETNLNEISNLYNFSKKANNQLAVDTIRAVSLVVNNLIGKTRNIHEYYNEELTEVTYLENTQKNQNLFAICIYKILKAQVLIMYQFYEEAKKNLDESKGLLAYITGMNSVAEHNFYHSLSLCGLYSKVSEEEKKQYFTQIEENQKQLKIWSDSCPENYLHKYILVEAEKAKVSGDKWTAWMKYKDALLEANKNGFIQVEALIAELAGRFWIENNHEQFTQNYLTHALSCYQKWGAKRKIEQMIKEFPIFKAERKKSNNLTSTSARSTAATTISGATTLHQGESLDLQSVLKSASAISSEIRLESLLEKLLKILIENAGAQRGVLLLKEKDWLQVEAEGSLEMTNVQIKIPLKEYKEIASTIVYYVERTKSNLVLENAKLDEKFKTDKYIQNNDIKSVLCAPIIKQGELTGVLYLENNLTTNAFTPDRLKIVNLLSSQSAISIENAILYSDMEQKVKERTAELAEKNEELAEKNKHITDSISYAQTIQNAILPSKSIISQDVPDFFILFRPKDIVSGDFYWYSKLDEYIFLAAVDCTGHGVPGALMSMLGKSFLDEIVNEKKQIDPAIILNLLDNRVRIALKQDKDGSESRDGMDICLCRIGKDELVFAGAKRPIIKVEDGEIETVKGDKDFIGGKYKGVEKEFTNHTFKIDKDKRKVFYLASDGFADQPNIERKKVGSRGLIQLISELHHLPGLEQREKFENFIVDFQNGEPQRDDITVIGLITGIYTN
ncbi:MAG: AAA family ATPase [Leptospiraceae bacterium]|nr:AAA family ATPase [Leptospiraceae bacterium]